jgi:molecular chaperone Hsp33
MEQTDTLLHFTLAGGAVRGLILRSTDTAREAQRLHGASAVAAAALGRALTATAMLAATLKEPDASVTLTLDGDGPLGKLLCVGGGGTVRGMAENPAVNLPLRNGRLDVGRAVGRRGRLSVVKDLRLKTPYVGQVELQTGEIAADLAYYYAQSEQSPTLVSLGVSASDTEVATAGGVLLQPLPDCPESVIDELELRSPIFGDVAGELAFETPDALLASWFHGLEPVKIAETPLAYGCPCSRKRMERALISLGEAELKRMIADEADGAELVCQFCTRRYAFTTADLLRLLNRIR